MQRKRTTIQPKDLLTQPLVKIDGLSDIWRLGPPAKRNFNKNVVDAVQIYKADDPTWHTTTWHSANWLRKNGYRLHHEQPFKKPVDHLPIRAYEVYSKYGQGWLYRDEVSFGIYAGHTAGQARWQCASMRMSSGVDNPFPDLRSRLVTGPLADAAIEDYQGRNKYWRDTLKYTRLQAECDDWNARWPVGTPVLLTRLQATGRDFLSRTRTPAWVPNLNGVMVSVEGHTGGFPLEEVAVRLYPDNDPRSPHFKSQLNA